MKLTKGTKSVLALGILVFVWFALMLFFRAFIYADMYIAPDDPYGTSDIIEFLMGIVFIALLSFIAITSAILIYKGKPQTKKAAIGLIVFCIVLFFSYPPLHTIASRLQG